MLNPVISSVGHGFCRVITSLNPARKRALVAVCTDTMDLQVTANFGFVATVSKLAREIPLIGMFSQMQYQLVRSISLVSTQLTLEFGSSLQSQLVFVFTCGMTFQTPLARSPETTVVTLEWLFLCMRRHNVQVKFTKFWEGFRAQGTSLKPSAFKFFRKL